ncbi:MAG: AI-2E family transporter [Burkholderiaceae bacterium]
MNTNGSRSRVPFYLLLAAVSFGLVYILLPFFSAVFWGTILAVLFHPLFRTLNVRFRNRRNLAALTTLLLATLVAVLPVLLLASALVQEIALAYEQLRGGRFKPTLLLQKVLEYLPDSLTSLLGRFGLTDIGELQNKLVQGAGQISQFMASQAVSIGQNTLQFAVGFGIMLYLVFFLLRDGGAITRLVREAIPLDPEEKRQLLERMSIVIRATVKGNVVVALAQGALGGVIFFALGIPGALLWGTVMAALSLLPAVGAALVWGPAAAYLIIAGPMWKGIVLILFGSLVIGMVDNVLRPVLVGKDTRLPDWVVLLSTVGGMSVFGINGFVIGPLIAAMFIACWGISRIEQAQLAPSQTDAAVGRAVIAEREAIANGRRDEPAESDEADDTAATAHRAGRKDERQR